SLRLPPRLRCDPRHPRLAPAPRPGSPDHARDRRGGRLDCPGRRGDLDERRTEATAWPVLGGARTGMAAGDSSITFAAVTTAPDGRPLRSAFVAVPDSTLDLPR